MPSSVLSALHSLSYLSLPVILWGGYSYHHHSFHWWTKYWSSERLSFPSITQLVSGRVRFEISQCDSRAWAVAAPEKLSLTPSLLPYHVLPIPPVTVGCTIRGISWGIRQIIEEPETERRSKLGKNPQKCFSKRGLCPRQGWRSWKCEGWFWLLRCLGALPGCYTVPSCMEGSHKELVPRKCP